MKTFKKLFSVSAIVALLGTLAPMYAFGATYSEEEQEAYAYAKAHGITTMETIEKANMEGNLTRVAMAKMIANYAIDVLGLEPDTSAKCTFSDVTAALDAQYNNGVTQACQLGLMGQGITAFRPNDLVTRGEFGTVLSRALNANDPDVLAEMNKANPFYKAHLTYLNEEGIMKNISDPDMTERRGWVMMMMMRADEEYTEASEGCSMNELLACFGSSDISACMAECNGNPEEPEEPLVVKAGTLNVSATANNGANIFLDGVSTLDTIKLNASEEINVEKVTLEKYGYTVNSGITVWLEDENGVEITNKTTNNFPTTKDTINLTIKRDYRNALETKAYVIVVEVADQTGRNVGDTLGFKVKDITSSAETLKIASYTPATYTMVQYDASNKLTAELKGSDETYNYEAGKMYQVAKLRVKAGNSEISVNGFTLQNESGLDLSRYVDGWEVKAGDTTLRLSASDIDRNKGTVKFTFPEQIVAAKKYVDLTVNMSLEDNFDQFGEAVRFNLTGVSALETKTSARLTATDAAKATYKFVGTKVKLTNTKLGKISAPRGKEDVVVAEGTLEIGEAINVADFIIGLRSTGALSTLELWLNGELVGEGSRTTNAKTGFKFSNVTFERGGKLQFVADLVERDDDNATGSTITFATTSFNKNLFSDNFGKYDESNKEVDLASVAGSISFNNITVETARGTLENTLISDEEVVTDQSTRTITVFEGTYKATKGDVYLNSGALELKVESGKKFTGEDSITAYVTVGDSEFDLTFDATGTKRDTFSNVLVKKGETVDVKIVAEITAQNTGKVNFTLTLAGEDEDGEDVDGVSKDSIFVDRIEKGSVTVTSNTAKDVVLRKNDLVLAKFTIQPKNDLTTLDGFVLTGVTLGSTALNSKLKVFVDDRELIEDGATEGERFTLAAGTLTVTGLEMDMGSDGIVVEIKFTAPATTDSGDVKMNLSTVNEKPVNKKFTTKIVPALVKITNQAINADGDETEYTIAITKSDSSLEVSNLCYELDSTPLVTGCFTTEVLSTENPYAMLNPATAKYIKTISYDVNGDTITLNKADFEDYFRVNGSFLKVFGARTN